MKVETYRRSPIETALKIEVSAERYSGVAKKIINKYARNFQIPGFRKGKAPAGMILRRLGSDALKYDVLKEVIPAVTMEAIDSQKIYSIGQPEITPFDQIEFEYGKPFTFEIVLQTKPEFELTGYKGLKLEKISIPLDIEVELEKRIHLLREQMGQMQRIEEDRPLQEGDIANVDFESFYNGEPVKNGSAKDHYMPVERGSLLPGFVENLVGKMPGEEWEFDVTFPQDYANKELAGKEIHFKMKLLGIMKKELPELNDEFAKSAGSFQTLEEMKEAIRKNILEIKEEQERNLLQEQIMTKLMEKLEGVMIPPALVELHLENFRRNVEQQFRMMGKDFNEYLKSEGMDIEDFKRKYYAQARQMAKSELVIDKIMTLENIEVTDQEIDDEILKFAQRNNQDPNKLKEIMEKSNQINQMRQNLAVRKVYDLLIENATFVEKSPDEIMGEGEATEEKVSDSDIVQEANGDVIISACSEQISEAVPETAAKPE